MVFGRRKKKKERAKIDLSQLSLQNWFFQSIMLFRWCEQKKIIFCDSDLAMKRKMASKKAISMTQINSIASSNGFQIVYGISAR